MDLEIRAGVVVEGIQGFLGWDFEEWYGFREFYKSGLDRYVRQVEVGD